MKNIKLAVIAVALCFSVSYASGASFVPTTGGDNTGVTGQGSVEPVSKKASIARDTIGGEVIGGVDNRYNVYVHITYGVVRTNENWAAWATPTTQELLQNRAYTNRVVTFRMTPEHLSQPIPTYTNEDYWIGGRITRQPSGPQLNVPMLRWRQRSSDITSNRPDGSLSNRFAFASGTVYSPQVIGVIWGPNGENGPRSEQQILDSGEDGATMVDEIVTLGMQSKYYTYADEQQRIGIVDYMTLVNLVLANTIEVVGTDGAVLASGTRSLQTTGADPGPITIAARVAGGNVYLTIVGATNDLPYGVVWQATSALGSTNGWTTLQTTSSTNEVARVASGGGNFYRVLRQ